MQAIKLILSIVLPLLFWLVSGGGNLSNADVVVLMASATAFLWNAIWQQSLCRTMGSDRFTYGFVFATLTGFFTFVALGLIWRILHAVRVEALAGFFSVGPYTLGILLALLMATWLLPVLTIRRQDPLPKIAERRELENPQ
jgi:hypothetical protein